MGLLISSGPSGLLANPIPFVLETSDGERGLLRCHLARANPQWSDLKQAPSCLVVFQGPDHYVSPSWYPTKKEHGRVVPTWNYAIVEAWGKATESEGKILMLADGNAAFAKATGLDLDLTAAGMGLRSKRYSMIVEDGVVKTLNIETERGVNVSGAETIMQQLKAKGRYAEDLF